MGDPTNLDLQALHFLRDVVLVVETNASNYVQVTRHFYRALVLKNIDLPVILKHTTQTGDEESFQLWQSSKMGALLIDGFGDGVWLSNTSRMAPQLINSTA